MATDYSMNLKAKLDTSDVQQKLQQLGQTGDMATSQLEQSVKKLEGAVKDLTNSWKTASKEAQQTGIQMQKLLRGGGAMLVGGMINRLGNYASATGNETGAQIANLAGNMLKGAGAGAAVGGGIGAAIGLTVGALDSLAEAATKSAQALEGWAKEGVKNIEQHFFDKITRDRLKEIAGIEDKNELEDIVKNAKKTQQEREDYIQGAYGRMRLAQEEEKRLNNKSYLGMSLPQAAAEMAKDNEAKDKLKMQIAQESANINQWDKQARGAAALQSAAEKKLEEIRQREIERVKSRLDAKMAQVNAKTEEQQDYDKAFEQGKAAAEAEQKAMEQATAKPPEEFLRNVGQAGSALSLFQRDRRLETFEKSLENMTPAELMSLRDSLSGKKAAAAAQVESLYGTAGQTGLDSDIEAAKKAEFVFDEIARMLDMTEMGLGGLTTPSIQEQMQALGSEAMKGYDTAGYGSLERDMYNVEKETQNNTKDAASSLSAIKSNINEIKNMMTQNSNKSVWG